MIVSSVRLLSLRRKCPYETSMFSLRGAFLVGVRFTIPNSWKRSYGHCWEAPCGLCHCKCVRCTHPSKLSTYDARSLDWMYCLCGLEQHISVYIDIMFDRVCISHLRNQISHFMYPIIGTRKGRTIDGLANVFWQHTLGVRFREPLYGKVPSVTDFSYISLWWSKPVFLASNKGLPYQCHGP